MKNWIFLTLIVLLFLTTRLYKISEIPGSVYWDEASIGYNAYSVGLNLKDEWGKTLPIHFRAFGEFKLPVYIYSVLVLTKLFGLNTFAVRLPSVLYGVATLVTIFFLAKKVTKSETVGLLSTLFLAFSPWYFIFSRTGYESVAGLFFFVLGIYVFILSLEKPKFFLFSTFLFIIAIYSYNSFRIVVPLFLLLEIFYISKKLIPLYLTSLILFGISLIPIIRLILYDAGTSRLLAVQAGNIYQIISNYFSHFSLQFLLHGDINSRSQIPNFGQVWLMDLPILFLGLVSMIKNKPKLYLLVLALLIIAPIPAAITKESPHALRTISILLPLAIIWGIGLNSIVNYFKNSKSIILASVIVILLISFESYFVYFATSYNKISSADWQYGYQEIFVSYKDDFDKFDKVIISDEYAQPYIFALYYLKYSPIKFRNDVKYNPVNNWGASTVASFGNFEFRKVTQKDINDDKTLIFASPKEAIIGIKPYNEIKFLDGTTAFLVYKR